MIGAARSEDVRKILHEIEFGLLTGHFEPALTALEEAAGSACKFVPAPSMLANLVFTFELSQWPAKGQQGAHFRGVDALFHKCVCSQGEIADALYSVLVNRGRTRGELEGQLHDLLIETAIQFPGEKHLRHARKIRRGADSTFPDA